MACLDIDSHMLASTANGEKIVLEVGLHSLAGRELDISPFFGLEGGLSLGLGLGLWLQIPAVLRLSLGLGFGQRYC